MGPGNTATKAILQSYPMFAALSGMVLRSMAPRMWRTLYFFAGGMWGTGILIMLSISAGWQIAPLMYGLAGFAGMTVWGVHLRGIAHDMAKTDKSPSNSQSTSDQVMDETVLVKS